jgi:hypothetical protein
MSVGGVTLVGVGVSAKTLAKVPGENLRVARAEFGAVWLLAECLGGQPSSPDDIDQLHDHVMWP